MSFKLQLLELFKIALEDSKELNSVQGVDAEQKLAFKNTPHYSQLLSLLEGYQKRYDRQHQSEDKKGEFKDEKSFKKLLMYVLKVLVQNVVLLESND